MHFAFQLLIIIFCILLYAIFLYYFPPVVDTFVAENAVTNPQKFTDLNALSSRVKQCDLGRLLHEIVRNYGRPSVPGFIYLYHRDDDPDDKQNWPH